MMLCMHKGSNNDIITTFTVLTVVNGHKQGTTVYVIDSGCLKCKTFNKFYFKIRWALWKYKQLHKNWQTILPIFLFKKMFQLA